MREKLNEQTAKTALPASGRNTIKYDTELRGFGLRVTKGSRSFILSYSISGRERRIDDRASRPDWSVAAARDEAKKLRRIIDQGIDRLAKRQEDRSAKTVADLWARYQIEHLPTLAPRTQADVRSMWKMHIGTQLIDVEAEEPDRLVEPVAHLFPDCGQNLLLAGQFTFEELLSPADLPLKNAGPALP